MKVVGLITEYNPFHNGHKYHIEEAKRKTGADYVIAVMSGNFVQRGTPAVIDKYSRTDMALNNGVDLVLELPVCYATGSAEYFAHGAIALLDKLGIVDFLCFGSECGDIGLLNQAAQFLSEAPAAYDEQLKIFLKEGHTYPAARQKALQYSLEVSSHDNKEALSTILSEPNNILGIEYIKAIRQLNSSMIPMTIQRISAHYHDSNLADTNGTDVALVENLIISSATAIRKAIHSKEDTSSDYFEEIKHSVPEDVFRILIENHLNTYPITEEDFSQIIKYKLLSEDSETLAGYLDISKDLADRLKKLPDLYKCMVELAQDIKTKNVTLTRINRALIHILLNIHEKDLHEYIESGYIGYARVLGIRKGASHLLRSIENNEQISIITKVSKAEEQLDSLNMQMLNKDIFATHLYNQAVYNKYGTTLPNEYKHGICMI